MTTMFAQWGEVTNTERSSHRRVKLPPWKRDNPFDRNDDIEAKPREIKWNESNYSTNF